jgi:hypothetical protein
VEDLVEFGGFKDAPNIIVNPDESELAPVGGDALHRFDKKSNAPTIDSLHIVKVDEDGPIVEFSRNADNISGPLLRGIGVASCDQNIEGLRMKVSGSCAVHFMFGYHECERVWAD